MRLRRVAAVLAGLLALVTMPACESQEEATGDPESEAVIAELDDDVALTLYLRTGSSADALLQPVTREVPIGDDLPRRAVELLLAGPVEGEDGLESPWPEGTEVTGVRVDGGAAAVDLSGAALEESAERVRAAHLESLALASLANTLTEFPAIDEVRLTVDGQSASSEALSSFWGGWGVPEVLTRDATLIVDRSEDPSPELARFVPESQEVGSREAEGVVVRSVRVRDRITYLRIVVEVADPADPDAPAPEFPPTSVRTSPTAVVLELRGVVKVEEAALPADLDEQVAPRFAHADVGEGATQDSFRLDFEAEDDETPAVYLHTPTSPTRIVMDVKK